MRHTAGKFSYDDATGALEGPGEFMDDEGSRLVREMSSGNIPAGLSAFFSAKPGTPTGQLIAVYFQTTYAGWKGTREILARSGRGA
jgi:hypothetical protein